MKQISLLGACALATALLLPQPSSACSDLIVGKKASADGSVMVSYSADSHTLYGDLVHYPNRRPDKRDRRQIRAFRHGGE